MRIEFFLFANDDKEVEDLEKGLFEFIYDLYQEGIYVRADRLQKAIDMFKDNFMVKQFLKS